MPAGPFVHIPGKVAAGQITVAELTGLALVRYSHLFISHRDYSTNIMVHL